LMWTENVQAINIKVRILSEFNVKSFDFKTVAGQYMLLCDNARVFEEDLKPGEAITISLHDSQIRVEKGIELIGTYAQVDLIGTRYSNVFSVQSPQAGKKRVYEERLSVSVHHGMLLINRIDLEKYVAGVVQSEVFGSSNDVEFFKIQATAARTYCLANLNRHLRDGYNMCDAVHCQSYKGKCTDADILRGTFETYGDVIVDSLHHLITPAYHSNSGGMTVDAGDIWQRSVSYLQAKVDSFSLNARKSVWEKTIPMDQWTAFFVSKYGQSYRSGEKQQTIRHLSQPQRMAYWVVDRDTIPTKLLRSHFQLRSSYFSVSPTVNGDSVLLNGKGYGHGVGLSQEGAIQMVRSGYGFQEIIKFYYNDVSVVKYADIIDF
ncbi:MAG: SpoIID/LytB domain-containing protein, partial [Bacteroidales bacterium]|nr:SpoIID/LytB domain-containing protein [Bacteroidales bacterium]